VDLAWSFALPAGVVLLLSLPGFGLRAAGPVAAGGKFALPGRAMVRIAAVAALCYVAEGAVADWSGVYLRTELGTDAARAASAYGFFALAMAAGRVGGDAVVRRAGARAVVRYGGGLAAVGFALLLAVPDPTVADASLAMIGLGLSNVVPLAFSAAGRLAGTSGIAMASTSGYAGFMASPPVIGAVADVLGLRLALLLVLAGVIAIASLSRVVSPAA
jgi:sugar phosphate permease